MRNYYVKLESHVNNKDYFINRAASSVDLDISKKLIHEINIEADIETDYNIGLIIGNSGSGKTTFAKNIFGEKSLNTKYNDKIPLINQFNNDLDYDERIKILSSIGLNSIPAWIKPVSVLSNGEKARAEIAIRLQNENLICIDEFTSVVDRTVAKIMSHSVQKFARNNNKKIICLSVHNDIIEWLNPDWIIDMNKQKYIDRRLLRQNYKRKEKIKFEIRECEKKSWKYFSKFHYLSDNLPGGRIYFFGLFVEGKQIGFQCFANYMPGKLDILHSNRTVIDPEYTGLGLGIKLINETSAIMKKRGFTILAKYSNKATYNSMIKDKKWEFLGANDNFGKSQFYQHFSTMQRTSKFRQGVITYQFKYKGEFFS
jgi:ABC-type Mn2+/Zn2+ transport system ATPase subunit